MSDPSISLDFGIAETFKINGLIYVNKFQEARELAQTQ
jgi:hypothetical protein